MHPPPHGRTLRRLRTPPAPSAAHPLRRRTRHHRRPRGALMTGAQSGEAAVTDGAPRLQDRHGDRTC